MTFNPEDYLSSLKPFQRKTVEHVFERFFGRDPVDRFLVADEVGLGKTMIARGVIAKLIEHHLKEPDRRIDVVYVCSNQSIAQQNFSKLALVGRDQRPVTDRITTLPLHAHGLNKATPGFDRGINIIPITPKTSLDLRSGIGRWDERVLLWWMLTHEQLLGPRGMGRHGSRRRAAAIRVLGPPVKTEERFEEMLTWRSPDQIDPDLWDEFARTVQTDGEADGPPVLEEFEELRSAFHVAGREHEPEWAERRTRLVARLRRLLAKSSVDSLEPDLVILDEFQRFPKLLDPSDPAGGLAEQLFRFEGCKSLLLSATPYRMFTRAHELDEEHHTDFLATTTFLMEGDRNPERVERLTNGMRDYRKALLALGDNGIGPVAEARDMVQSELQRVMCRTERLGVSNDRNGMLETQPERPIRSVLKKSDLDSYRELDQVARDLGTRDVLEFWKSTPYALNLMEGYALSDRFEARGKTNMRGSLSHLLDADAVRDYRRVDPANSRLRGLIEDLDERRAWQQLWLTPSLLYYEPAAPFDKADMTSKRLVFSSWAVVPKAVATLTSFHVERQILEAHNKKTPIKNDTKGRHSLGSPLNWVRGRGMTETLFLLPAATLGRLTDPLAITANLRARGEQPTARSVVRESERRVREQLAGLELPYTGGRTNPAWYATAILRLEELERSGSTGAWLTDQALGKKEGTAIWRDHVKRLRRYLTEDPEGAVPKDLAKVLALVGLGSPAVCAIRALGRVVPEASAGDRAAAALRIGDAMRLMFDLPESVALVRRLMPDKAHWRATLRYGLNGNLQAILDEYFHVLRDWVGDDPSEGKLGPLRDTAVESIGVNAASLSARDISPEGRVRKKQVPMRTRFALRLSDGTTEDDASVTRIDSVRKAFNSPFWPFVLATTSIGQEGLDFHLYCHSLVHWNLPHNPVDLEQREGRIHRYKNHAVRRNLGADRAEVGLAEADHDPWEAMFKDAGERDDGGIYPEWVYLPENGKAVARIERHVPSEPLSADRQRLEDLVRLLGVYRLAFGQPRQEELLAALKGSPEVEAKLRELTIDLSPAGRSLSRQVAHSRD